MTPYRLFLYSGFSLLWLWAAIAPLDPHGWLLENVLVFAGAPFLLYLGWRFRLSDLSHTLLTIFLATHVFASHYTYAEVPWGYALGHFLGTTRNMYDRFVHFSYGLLLIYPLQEIAARIGLRGFWRYYFPLETIFATAALYEIMEWITEANVNSALGTAFIGAQGDFWDTPKDMAMAGLGAFLASGLLALARAYRARRGYAPQHIPHENPVLQ